MAIGNPTILGSRAKFESATDWVFAAQPRFNITRYYRSTDTISTNGLLDTFGKTWALDFSERKENTVGNTLSYSRADGSRYSFLRQEDAGAFELPEFSGYPFKGRKETVYEPWTANLRNTYDIITEKSGLERWSRREFVNRLQWPDGYQIQFRYSDVSIFHDPIEWMWGNRGNGVRFVYTSVEFPSGSARLLTSIEIDTNLVRQDYSYIPFKNFTPIVRLNYEYGEHEGNLKYAPLERVTRTDCLTSALVGQI